MGKYLDLIRHEEANRQQVPTTKSANLPTLPSPGHRIYWEGADGKERLSGVVDFFHSDAGGAIWAFVTLPDGHWTAVNLKYATHDTQK